MKKVLSIAAVNIAVFIVSIIVLELALRLLGMDTINGMEFKAVDWERNYKSLCREIRGKKMVVLDKFFTDGDGIFKANPGFNFSKNKKLRGISINADGFRGNEFKSIETSKTKILMVGDSFLWGATAIPITNSFADLIQNAGYHVYNAGIPATDPVQYANIVKKYTPLLKPDVVSVCLYLGNDVREFPDPIQPNKQLRYTTNIAMFRGFDDNGKYFNNAAEAFDYFKKRKCGYCTSIWDYFTYKTVIGKHVYDALNKNHLKIYKNKEWVTQTLEEMHSVCKETGAEFLIFLIPVVRRLESKSNSIQNNIHLFQNFGYYYPKDLKKDDYHQPPNCHFNNQGHKKYADFIIGVLREKGYH